MRLLPLKLTLFIVAFVGIAAVPDLIPALSNYRIVAWNRIPAVMEFPAKSPVPEEETFTIPPGRNEGTKQVYPLEETGTSLDHFYEALRHTEAGEAGAVTKILHYGDSPTTADLITADARAMLQAQFGDAGHGFVLIGKPWAWYGHRGVELSSSGWQTTPANNQNDVRDGLFGLGGVTFLGSPGAESRISLRESGHTAIEVAYLFHPSGGLITVEAGGKVLGQVDTVSPTAQPGFSSFDLPPDAERITLRVVSGRPRVFGVQLVKPGPGVRYHSLGLNGAYISVLSKMFSEDHWSQQLKHYNPDLVIINYGTNESVYTSFVDKSYGKEVREAIRRVHAALPDASILVMSPMDRGQRSSTGEIVTVPALSRLVGMQQKIAAEGGCGFFNTYEAMGGPGTMGRWYTAEPRKVSADFIHPMPNGAKIVGNLLYRGILNGYNKYKLRRMQEQLASVKPAVKDKKGAAAR